MSPKWLESMLNIDSGVTNGIQWIGKLQRKIHEKWESTVLRYTVVSKRDIHLNVSKANCTEAVFSPSTVNQSIQKYEA